MNEEIECELCGAPMPKGEEMFRYHGHSGPCPRPPMWPRTTIRDNTLKCGICSHSEQEFIDLKDALAARLIELERKRGACEVCWTVSWTPIKDKADADGVNTIGPDQLARCEHCWLHKQYEKQDARLREMEGALKKAIDSLEWLHLNHTEIYGESAIVAYEDLEAVLKPEPIQRALGGKETP